MKIIPPIAKFFFLSSLPTTTDRAMYERIKGWEAHELIQGVKNSHSRLKLSADDFFFGIDFW